MKIIKKRVDFTPYILIAPIFILLFMFSLYPLMQAFIKSFYRYDAISINEFIGLENYKNLFFRDEAFWKSMRNLLVLFGGMHICFCFPIIAAKLLHSISSKRFQYALRTTFVIPMVVPAVVSMMLWKFIYYPQIGMIARIATSMGLASPNLLGTQSTALFAIILINFPWVSGLPFLTYFSAFQNVDRSQIEAAKIDGASAFQIFKKIELPNILPQIKALYLISIIGQFQDYERFLILTDGGPNNATLVPGLHMYHQAFPAVGESEYGYACAIAVILFMCTIVMSKVLIRNKEDE